MRKNPTRILTGILVCGVSISLNGCLSPELTREHLPEETIEAYEDAVNNLDVDAMMECLDESTKDAMTAGMDVTMGIVGAVTGIDLGIDSEDLIDMMPFFNMITEEYGLDQYPQVDFQVTKTLIKGDKATVYFTEAGTGQEQIINMVKEGGKWYFTLDITPISEEEADRVLLPGEAAEEENSLSVLGDMKLEDLVKRPLSEIFDWDQLEEKVNQAQNGDENSGLLSAILGEVFGNE